MSYGYRRGYTNRAPLTPPAELVGKLVRWSPKRADGKRNPAVTGWVDAFDSEARTLTIRVPQETSYWQPNPERVVTVPLSSGPFTPLN